MEAYEKLTAEEKRALAPFDKIQSIGVEPSRHMAAWLWDHRVAAIATDSPAVEPLPMNLGDEGLLHYRALPLLGLPLGELFVLGPLAEDCARDRRYQFLLVSAPLHIEGGVASPPNALAIK
jgi:kynurenine formamidase